MSKLSKAVKALCAIEVQDDPLKDEWRRVAYGAYIGPQKIITVNLGLEEVSRDDDGSSRISISSKFGAVTSPRQIRITDSFGRHTLMHPDGGAQHFDNNKRNFTVLTLAQPVAKKGEWLKPLELKNQKIKVDRQEVPRAPQKKWWKPWTWGRVKIDTGRVDPAYLNKTLKDIFLVTGKRPVKVSVVSDKVTAAGINPLTPLIVGHLEQGRKGDGLCGRPVVNKRGELVSLDTELLSEGDNALTMARSTYRQEALSHNLSIVWAFMNAGLPIGDEPVPYKNRQTTMSTLVSDPAMADLTIGVVQEWARTHTKRAEAALNKKTPRLFVWQDWAHDLPIVWALVKHNVLKFQGVYREQTLQELVGAFLNEPQAAQQAIDVVNMWIDHDVDAISKLYNILREERAVLGGDPGAVADDFLERGRQRPHLWAYAYEGRGQMKPQEFMGWEMPYEDDRITARIKLYRGGAGVAGPAPDEFAQAIHNMMKRGEAGARFQAKPPHVPESLPEPPKEPAPAPAA